MSAGSHIFCRFTRSFTLSVRKGRFMKYTEVVMIHRDLAPQNQQGRRKEIHCWEALYTEESRYM